jgi:hypothetical protein
MSDFVFGVLKLNTQLIELIMSLNSVHPAFLSVYLTPSVLAFFLKRQNLRAIFASNLLLGFTGITWFVVLLWVIVEVKQSKPDKPAGQECKHCKELIRPGASKCHHCHTNI